MRGPRGLRVSAPVVAAALTAVGVGGISPSLSAGADESQPVVGQREVLTLLAGSVTVRIKGATTFTPLLGSIDVPDESEVDASRGRVEITVATAQGAIATATAYQGRFLLHQDGAAPAEAHLVLSAALSGCSSAHRPRGAGNARASIAGGRRRRSVKSRQLWVSDNGGSWGTSGHYVSTTVEGTRWLTSDECRRSRVAVAEGVVLVRDLIHHTSSSVTAGHEFVAALPAIERAGFVPQLGQVLAGESGGEPQAFQRQTGKHVSVFGFFGSWFGEFRSLVSYVHDIGARLLLHLSTDSGYGSGAGQEISPAAIARGQSDGYLVQLCTELSTSEAPVYLALLPEMNQANNAYSAFNANGSSRGPSNSTSAFRQAWRRSVLIVRGGGVSLIDRRLRALGLPALKTSLTTLPRPKVSFMWAPQTAGTPDTPANSPAAYYPGSAYVDIIGTDFYSAFPNFSGLKSLYEAYPSKPFGFNEWAMWKNGDPGFVTQLFNFVRSHRRIALMVYNDGLTSDGPFRLERFPAARSELRRQLSSPRFLAFPPE
jgi:hypothetical protein